MYIRHKLLQEGGRALMSGLTASILGISHALIYFPLYEHWKMFFKKTFEPDSDRLSSRYVFVSAIISKCKQMWKSTNSIYNLVLSSAITYPHEVLRSRQ